MKKNITLLFLLFYFLNFSQRNVNYYTFDANGKQVTKEYNLLKQKFPNLTFGYKTEKDSGKIYRYNVPKSILFQTNYPILKSKIEHLKKTKFNDSINIILKYLFKEGSCDNEYKDTINNQFLQKLDSRIEKDKKAIEKNNSVVLYLIDSKLEMLSNSYNNYFFLDIEDFFKKHFFKNNCNCSSTAIIRPNGKVLVINSDFGLEKASEVLKSGDNDFGRTFTQVPKYSIYNSNYEIIKKHIEDKTSKKIDNSTIFFIRYQFKDDILANVITNKIDKSNISTLKKEYNSVIKKYRRKKILFLVFFEKEISFKNNLSSKNEYFFSDNDNFFKNIFFSNPTLSGSNCLIKPNGQTLVINGENNIEYIATLLKQDTWSLIFKK